MPAIDPYLPGASARYRAAEPGPRPLHLQRAYHRTAAILAYAPSKRTAPFSRRFKSPARAGNFARPSVGGRRRRNAGAITRSPTVLLVALTAEELSELHPATRPAAAQLLRTTRQAVEESPWAAAARPPTSPVAYFRRASCWVREPRTVRIFARSASDLAAASAEPSTWVEI